MNHEIATIEDMHSDESTVTVVKYERCGNMKHAVNLDFDPNNCTDCTLMQFTPEQARKLAAALILAADEVEKA